MKPKVSIIPAILESDEISLRTKLEAVAHWSKLETVQIDICDGIFTPRPTVTDFSNVKLSDKLQWQAHLMIAGSFDYASLSAAGFTQAILHYESFATENELTEHIKIAEAAGLQVGLAVLPRTAVTVLRYFTDTIKHFVVLGVNGGAQGETILSDVYLRLHELRSFAPNATIQVDGGVKLNLIPELLATGLNEIVVGSGIFASPDSSNWLSNYQTFVSETNNHSS